MTIKEFAKNQGISTQAVYQRIKGAGVELSEIKKPNTAELTAHGLEILKSIFARGDAESGKKLAELKNKLAEQSIEIEKLRQEAAELRKERDGWRAQAERWTAIAETAQKQADNMQEALLRAQAINMASLQAAASAPRLSLWQRLTGKRLKAAEQPEKAAADAAQEAEKK